MLGDLNEDLLKVNRLEHILNKLDIFQLIKEAMLVAPRSKTLIGVIITNNRDTVMHACRNISLSLSIADHHAVSCTINLRNKIMTPFQIYGRIYANYDLEKF